MWINPMDKLMWVVLALAALIAAAALAPTAGADTTAYCVTAKDGGLWCADELGGLPIYLQPSAITRQLHGLADHPKFTQVERISPLHQWCDTRKHPRIPVGGEILITTEGVFMRLRAGRKALTWDHRGRLVPCTR